MFYNMLVYSDFLKGGNDECYEVNKAVMNDV